MSQQHHLQSPAPKPRYQISTPPLSAAQMLALLLEAGVPEIEARRRIEGDPTLAVDSATDLG